MKKIYLAANYEDHEKMESDKKCLEGLGHKVVSTWHCKKRIKEAEDYKNKYEKNSADVYKKYMSSCAKLDLEEIEECDTLILDNTTVSETGGKHFECGYAYAKGKQILLIGNIKNVFHYLS